MGYLLIFSSHSMSMTCICTSMYHEYCSTTARGVIQNTTTPISLGYPLKARAILLSEAFCWIFRMETLDRLGVEDHYVVRHNDDIQSLPFIRTRNDFHNDIKQALIEYQYVILIYMQCIVIEVSKAANHMQKNHGWETFPTNNNIEL